MAKERLPALYVAVLAKNRSWVTQSLNARNAAVLGSAVVTCAVVLAKSSQLIQISPEWLPRRRRFPLIIHEPASDLDQIDVQIVYA